MFHLLAGPFTSSGTLLCIVATVQPIFSKESFLSQNIIRLQHTTIQEVPIAVQHCTKTPARVSATIYRKHYEFSTHQAVLACIEDG